MEHLLRARHKGKQSKTKFDIKVNTDVLWRRMQTAWIFMEKRKNPQRIVTIAVASCFIPRNSNAGTGIHSSQLVGVPSVRHSHLRH